MQHTRACGHGQVVSQHEQDHLQDAADSQAACRTENAPKKGVYSLLNAKGMSPEHWALSETVVDTANSRWVRWADTVCSCMLA
jgi:hypothetical protein